MEKGCWRRPFCWALKKKLEFLVCFVPGRMGEDAPLNHVSLFHLFPSPRPSLCPFLLHPSLSSVTVRFSFQQRGSQRAPFIWPLRFSLLISLFTRYSLRDVISAPTFSFISHIPNDVYLSFSIVPCPYTRSPFPLLFPF